MDSLWTSVGMCDCQNQNMMEMKTRLEELHMEHEYQLRLKAMSYNEKIRELSDQLTQQVEFLERSQQVCCSPAEQMKIFIFIHITNVLSEPADHENADGPAGTRAPAEICRSCCEARKRFERLG